MSEANNRERVKALWEQAMQTVRSTATSPALFRALEKIVPVAYEDNNFVVGFAMTDGALASQINAGENFRSIERTLREVTGDSTLRFRIIEGTERSDWEYIQKRDAAAVRQQQGNVEKQARAASSFGTWDEIYEQMSRMWSVAPNRNLTVGRGKFLHSALATVEKAMETLYQPEADGTYSELAERGLSRVIDRIASMSNTDASAIAYFLLSRTIPSPDPEE